MRCVLARTASSFNGGCVSGKEDAVNNSARVHLHMVQRIVDLTCLLLERLWVDDGENLKLSFVVWACPPVPAVVGEPYNTVLYVHSLLGRADVALMVDNEASYDTDRQNLDIERPPCANLNLWITEIISAVPAPPSRRRAVRKSHGVQDTSGVLPVHYPYALQVHADHLSGQGPTTSHRLWLKIAMSISELATMMVKSSRVLQ